MKRYFYLICIILFSVPVWGQSGSVGIGTSNPHSSAALEIRSSQRGLLIPRVTTSQKTAISEPATGLMVFDLSLSAFSYYDGSQWRTLQRSNDVWNRSSGNLCNTADFVGIGTCEPKNLLHLHSDTSDVRMRLSTTGANYIVGIDETEGSFYVGRDSSNTLEKLLVLKRPGYLGIGTDAPRSSLHVHANTGSTQITLTNSATSEKYIVGIDETEGSMYLGRDSAGTLDKILVIDSSGRVGIDHIDPSARLFVDGKIKADEVELNDGNGNSYILSPTSGSPWAPKAIDLYKTNSFSLATTYQDISWNASRIIDNTFTHSSAIVIINETGLYQVTYSVSGHDSNRRSTVKLLKDAGGTGSFADVPGSFGYAVHDGSSSLEYGTITRTVILSLTAGDKLKVQGKSDSNTIQGAPEACGFTIIKLR